jgi:hypothetical protein
MDDGEAVAQILKVESMSFDEKYLGLPVPEGWMKDDKFQPTKERLRKKCSDWSEKYMSGAAKETLIKSVAQAISTYAMSVFKFSAGLCDELSQIIREFWWGDEFERRKVHWLGWEKMTRPKIQGGIGFRDLRLFNQALLAKQAWRLLEYPESLCARLLKAKYYPTGELLDTVFPKNVSPCWQGITYGLELLKHGMIWRVNSGSKIRVWRDNWLPRGNLKPIGNASKIRIKWVSDLIEPSTKTWKEDMVRKIFYPPDAETVLQISIPAFEGDDRLAWSYDQTGIFSVKSAYRLALDLKDKDLGTGVSSKPAGERELWDIIWKANVPPKIRVFGWKLATNSLGVQATRCNRNMDVIPTCSICGREEETSHHAMINCTKAKSLRQRLRESWTLPEEEKLMHTGKDWVLILLNQLDKATRDKMLFIWWRAWHMRNNIIFGDGKCGIEQSALYLLSYYDAFHGLKNMKDRDTAKGKQIAHDHLTEKENPARTPAETWKKPRHGWAKLNSDASFSESEGAGAWGAILWDDLGEVVMSAWGPIPHSPNAVTSEALGMLYGLRATLPIYAGPLQIESDNAFLINEVKSTVCSKSLIAGSVGDIKHITASFQDCLISKINRTTNGVADGLAREGHNVLSECVVLARVPPCVVETLKHDCKQNFMP